MYTGKMWNMNQSSHLAMATELKNFLPGPTMVNPDVLAQLSQPIIGHHTPEFHELMGRIHPALQRLMFTKHPVFAFTGTASTAMEAALTNAGGDKMLIVSNGLFGERWGRAAARLNLNHRVMNIGWGTPYDPAEIRRTMNFGKFESLVVVHGETSTGMLNPLEPIHEMLQDWPEVLLIVDAVATLGGADVKMDALGIDVLIGGSQKCLALPPGISPVGVSPRALRWARGSFRKGYAHDFNLWQERWRQNEVICTPALPQLYALAYQLTRLEEETLQARWERHTRLSKLAQSWAAKVGWKTCSPEGYILPSVSCLVPPTTWGDTTRVVESMREHGYLIDCGVGKLQGKSIRLGHMGEWQEDDVKEMLAVLGKALKGR
jgi:aspartate aminotransferase-like enzyme